MGIALFVECRIGIEHLRRDPRAAVRVLRPWSCAMLHHIAKTAVEREGEEAGTKASFQAARHVEFFGKEHSPGIGRPPQDGLIVVVPWKDAVAVGFEQPLGAQIAPDGEQSFWRCQINGREAKIRWVCAEPEQGPYPFFSFA